MQFFHVFCLYFLLIFVVMFQIQLGVCTQHLFRFDHSISRNCPSLFNLTKHTCTTYSTLKNLPDTRRRSTGMSIFRKTSDNFAISFFSCSVQLKKYWRKHFQMFELTHFPPERDEFQINTFPWETGTIYCSTLGKFYIKV